MQRRLEGKVAVVTGSTRGIGAGIAMQLAEQGAQIVVSGVHDEDGWRVEQRCNALGGSAIYTHADVRVATDCSSLIEQAFDRFGRVDVLVNNAGVFPSLALEDTTPEVWDEVFAVNVRGAFLCTRAAIPFMQRSRGGAIINIGSTLAYRSDADRLAYSASKGALLTLTKAVARSYATDRIRANWITVGWVASPGEIELRDAQHGDGRAYLSERGAATPFGRFETPDDVAAGVIFLASDEASHVTGCELNVSGALWI